MPSTFIDPPTVGNIQKMNRDLFKKVLTLGALKVSSPSCSRIMNGLRKLPKTMLDLPKTKTVVDDPDSKMDKSHKLILLHPDVKSIDHLSSEAKSILELETFQWSEYSLNLTYDFWSSDQILRSILPSGTDIPTSFESIGHIAHLNLRENLLPYKNIIGQVILDKNKHIKTVVNKIDSIDHTFRFFKMEVLAGEDNFLTELKESNCIFEMDYSKVYWNSRLQGEHARLVSTLFKKEEKVCDVFAGIGPFAVPAAKNSGCIVFANDLNPMSYQYLNRNVERNKMDHKVVTFNLDGKDFIMKSQKLIENQELWNQLKSKGKKYEKNKKPENCAQIHEDGTESISKPLFDHYVMNLPATALEFLVAFRGIYNGKNNEDDFKTMPLIHCYCFSSASDMENDVRERASHYLGYTLKDYDILQIHRVRDVSPKKEMLCISFRLPKEVAFFPSKSITNSTKADVFDLKRKIDSVNN